MTSAIKMIRAVKKLLTTSVVSILLISLAGGVYGQAGETIEYNNGDVYTGQVKDGQPHGHSYKMF
jgi:hypothetical protein